MSDDDDHYHFRDYYTHNWYWGGRPRSGSVDSHNTITWSSEPDDYAYLDTDRGVFFPCSTCDIDDQESNAEGSSNSEVDTLIPVARTESRSQKKFDHAQKRRWKPFKEPKRRPISANSAASDKKSGVKTSRRHRLNQNHDLDVDDDIDSINPVDIDTDDPMHQEETWDWPYDCDCTWRATSFEEARDMFITYHRTNWRRLLPDCLDRWVRDREGKVHPMSDIGHENEEENIVIVEPAHAEPVHVEPVHTVDLDLSTQSSCIVA